MREIKFRAFDKKDNIMWEPMTLSDLILGGWEMGTNEGSWSLPHDDYIEFAHEDTIWLESTGLKDRNGVEIYKRDVVKSGNGRLWEVKHGHYLVKEPKQMIELYGWYIQGTGCCLPLNEGLEVIGNSLEHPHLLNEGAK